MRNFIVCDLPYCYEVDYWRSRDVKCLGSTITNENCIQKEIKRRLNSVNACNCSVQSILSFRFLSKNLKIKIHRTTILYGCEICSITTKEDHTLRVFENRVLWSAYLDIRGRRWWEAS
jgi:hypothetical protein